MKTSRPTMTENKATERPSEAEESNEVDAAESSSQTKDNLGPREAAVQPGAVAVEGPQETAPEAQREPMEEEGEETDEVGHDVEADEETDTASKPKAVQSSSLPVAEEYQELPIVAAEVVKPPPSAVLYRVDIDVEESAAKAPDEKPQKLSTWKILALATIVLIAAAVAVAVAVTQSNNETKDFDKGEAPAPIYNYTCYTSTVELMAAQISADPNLPQLTLIICPNTRIKIGTFRNPSRDDYNITNGDYPISALRPNLTVQCGLDGSRSNNCTLDGGLSQVVNQYSVYHPQYGFQTPAPSLDNFIVQGLTFTGKIEGSGIFGGIPVIVSHPGDTRFEDCAWVDMTATKRVIAVGRNYLMDLLGVSLDELSVSLTLSNCLFDNVLYDEDFLLSIYQSLRVENTLFRNINLPELLPPGCAVHPNGCRNLMHCLAGGRNNCSIHNICVQNFDTTGAGPIVISELTEWSSSGINTWYGPPEFQLPFDSSETVSASNPANAPMENAPIAPDQELSITPNNSSTPSEILGPTTDDFQGAQFDPVPEFVPGFQYSPGANVGGLSSGNGVQPFCDFGVAVLVEGNSTYDCEETAFTPTTTLTCPGLR